MFGPAPKEGEIIAGFVVAWVDDLDIWLRLPRADSDDEQEAYNHWFNTSRSF